MADPLSEPMRTAFLVTPSDTADLAVMTRGVYCGGAGNLKVDMADGTTVVFTAVPIGYVLPIRARRIYATLTTSTLIIGLA